MITTPDRPAVPAKASFGAFSAIPDTVRHPILAPLIIYLGIAMLIFAIQGPEPSLSLDHITYFELADEIRTDFPKGDYWRTFNSVRMYGVVLAYLFDLTGSHITSLKLLLGAMTVAYFAAFQVLMSLFTDSPRRAVLFSLLSGLFVTFGASIWGVTDFAASLNRTVIIPFVILLVWFFFRFFHSPWRYAVFPGLIALSLLHLSALHVFLVFGAFEALDYVFRRRLRIDLNIAWFILSIVASVMVQFAIESFAAGTSSYIRYTFNMAVPPAMQIIPPEAPKKPLPPPSATAKAAEAPAPQPFGAPTDKKLSSKQAWQLELLAFPWRNFPPSLATLLTIASSFGVIFLLAVAGAVRVFRSGSAGTLDRAMVVFAFGVVLAAWGLQTLLWILRDRTSVFPVNFEEVRAINMVMIPAVYFCYKLYESAPSLGRLSQRAVRIAIVALFALQPILIAKSLPVSWREAMIDRAVAAGLLKTSDAPRMLYARQFLGLASEGRRFFYSSRGALGWLERNLGPNETVLTNLNEFYGSKVRSVGPFLGIVVMDVWDPRRAKWADALVAVDRALAAHDLDKIKELARGLGASYAVVDWPVEDAAYRDAYYSVVRVW